MADREVAVVLVDGTTVTSDFNPASNILSNTKPTWTYQKLRSAQFGDVVNRNPIQEEAMDVSVAAEIDAGTYGLSGTLETALRVDPATQVLFGSLCGKQTSGHDYTLYLTQTPQELSIRVTDEMARASGVTEGTSVYYMGCGMSSCELTLNVKEYAKCKWSWIGRRGISIFTPDNDAVSTFTDYPMLVFYNAVLTFGGSTIKCQGVTLTIDRKFDTDFFYIGSQFLQGIIMNGMTTLGGSLNLAADEWLLLNRTINGTVSAGALDGTKHEFQGDNANALASGILSLTFRKPDATAAAEVIITCQNCKITDMNRSVQNRNRWEKSVSFQCAMSATTDFSIVFDDRTP